ncbi:MAG: DUF6443 domain-containing protein, partial [Bacteroidota bacterium]|nr:DUF6443 domain-containing protein [Bacteroidota bacterium]
MKLLCSFLTLGICFQTTLAQEFNIIKPDQGEEFYTVSENEVETLIAKKSIVLGPGTEIQEGSTFTAKIVFTFSTEPYQDIVLNDYNYVYSIYFQKAMLNFLPNNMTEGDVVEKVDYFDGLGRPMQKIGIKSAPDTKDLVTHMEYDIHGRQEKDWLSYYESDEDLGSYRGKMDFSTRTYYKTKYGTDFAGMLTSNTNAYSQREYELSPLNRVLKLAAPGKDWQLGAGNEVEFEYTTNVYGEVRKFSVELNFSNNAYYPTLVNNGYYGSGELFKKIIKDENHKFGTNNTIEEFTDKMGRMVLSRTQNNGDHDTYYVYDAYGNLSYVIPPKVTTSNVSSVELNELCYQYVYDERNRLVEKKLPGKAWEYIVYNGLNQPIMVQDGVQNTNHAWFFTQYDAFGRVAYTGIDTGNTSSRNLVQIAANGASNYVTRTVSPNSYAGTTVYYTKNAYPTSFDQIYSMHYYDTYVDTDGISLPSTILGQTTATDVRGLPTVKKLRVLGTNSWITMLTGYDNKGRVIYMATKNNFLNTFDIEETELDFGGKVMQTKTTHKREGNEDIVTLDTFVYDHEGRMLIHKQKINDQPEVILQDNTYDDLGYLINKKVGNGIQSVDFTYNVRGWLKQINNPDSLGDDLFAFRINYNATNHNGTPLYNGNISETEWRTANIDNTLKWYRYGYDPLNRITSATSSSTNYHMANIGYDMNGNILKLTRKGHINNEATLFGTMDFLQYTYDSGNKLTRIVDNGNDFFGFVDGANLSTEYTYDANGNMLTDANKGITGITYNHLNLPTAITTS